MNKIEDFKVGTKVIINNPSDKHSYKNGDLGIVENIPNCIKNDLVNVSSGSSLGTFQIDSLTILSDEIHIPFVKDSDWEVKKMIIGTIIN